MHLPMLLFETSRPMIQNTLFQPENYFKTGTNHDLRGVLSRPNRSDRRIFIVKLKANFGRFLTNRKFTEEI